MQFLGAADDEVSVSPLLDESSSNTTITQEWRLRWLWRDTNQGLNIEVCPTAGAFYVYSTTA